MSRARLVVPGLYMIERNCSQQQFLLKPDDETNNAFVYCLVEAAQRFQIEIILPVAMSNHHHTMVYDRHARLPAFLEHFHKMFARCQNARLGRWENLWAAEEVCVTRILDNETAIEKLLYCATNPVKDHLVERATQWPGVNGYRNLVNRRPLRATRPRHFFRENGSMPEVVEMMLVIPPELGQYDEVVLKLKALVEAFEQRMRDERASTGRRLFGRANVLAQNWRSASTTVKKHRSLRPRFAGKPEARVRGLLEYKAFQAAYAYARKLWLAGKAAVFPAGTYWLAQFAPVEVAPPGA